MSFIASRKFTAASSPAVEIGARIDALRFYLILSLVFLHYGSVYGSDVSAFSGYRGQAAPIASILVSFVLFFAFTAVPMLATISGWLFFRNATSAQAPDFRRLWKRRLTSIVVPFVLWSAAAVVGALVLRLKFPDLFIGSLGEPGSAGPLMLLNAVLGVTEPPLAVQFWFVRDLIVSIALAPIVWLAASRVPVASLALLAVAWLTEQTLGVFLRLDTFLFFFFGAVLAIHRLDVTPDERLAPPLFVTFLMAVGLRTIAPWLTGVDQSVWFDVGSSLMRVLGVAAMWSISGVLTRGLAGRLAAQSAPTVFFIYCAHFPLIFYVKTLLGRLHAPEGDAELVVHYLVTVALTLLIMAIMARVLRILWPSALAVLSGGRMGA